MTQPIVAIRKWDGNVHFYYHARRDECGIFLFWLTAHPNWPFRLWPLVCLCVYMQLRGATVCSASKKQANKTK